MFGLCYANRKCKEYGLLIYAHGSINIKIENGKMNFSPDDEMGIIL